MATEENDYQPRLPLKDVPDEIQKKVADFGGNPNLNLYKTLASNPVLLTSLIDFTYSLRLNCTTSRQLRELMILRGAQILNSTYEWFQHEKMAKKFGVSQEKIDSVQDWKTSALFDDKERVAIELMESLIQNKGKINDELDQQLKKYFAESEYIELILTGSFYVMIPTLLVALQTPVEK